MNMMIWEVGLIHLDMFFKGGDGNMVSVLASWQR